MILKRIKNLWSLSGFKVKEDDRVLADGVPKLEREILLGDGKAEYLGEGTAEEFEEAERERKGFKNIFGIGK